MLHCRETPQQVELANSISNSYHYSEMHFTIFPLSHAVSKDQLSCLPHALREVYCACVCIQLEVCFVHIFSTLKASMARCLCTGVTSFIFAKSFTL